MHVVNKFFPKALKEEVEGMDFCSDQTLKNRIDYIQSFKLIQSKKNPSKNYAIQNLFDNKKGSFKIVVYDTVPRKDQKGFYSLQHKFGPVTLI